jgi:hypothetical protein
MGTAPACQNWFAVNDFDDRWMSAIDRIAKLIIDVFDDTAASAFSVIL